MMRSRCFRDALLGTDPSLREFSLERERSRLLSRASVFITSYPLTACSSLALKRS